MCVNTETFPDILPGLNPFKWLSGHKFVSEPQISIWGCSQSITVLLVTPLGQ